MQGYSFTADLARTVEAREGTALHSWVDWVSGDLRLRPWSYHVPLFLVWLKTDFDAPLRLAHRPGQLVHCTPGMMACKGWRVQLTPELYQPKWPVLLDPLKQKVLTLWHLHFLIRRRIWTVRTQVPNQCNIIRSCKMWQSELVLQYLIRCTYPRLASQRFFCIKISVALSCGSTSFPWLVFFFAALLWGSMIHKHRGRWMWQGSMRCYLKILCISYKDHVTNNEVHAKIQQAIEPHKNLLTIVKR